MKRSPLVSPIRILSLIACQDEECCGSDKFENQRASCRSTDANSSRSREGACRNGGQFRQVSAGVVSGRRPANFAAGWRLSIRP